MNEGATNRFTASYDGSGTRISKTDSWTGAHNYSWGPGGLVYDSSGNTIYTPGLSQQANGMDRYPLHDWLGSTRYLTDGSQVVKSALRFDAFGNRSLTGGTDPYDPSDFQFGAGWGYQTEYANGVAEPGLGLQLLGQRYYDPAVGRFISQDPLGPPAGPNTYEYAGNDPVMDVDPLGLLWKEVLGTGGTVLGGVVGSAEGGVGAIPGAVVGDSLGTYLGAELDGSSVGAGIADAAVDGLYTYAGEKLFATAFDAYRIWRSARVVEAAVPVGAPFLEACPRVLGRNLEAAKITRLALVAAHHIVAGSAKRAAPARKVLRRFGVGINDAVNGQFLPIQGSSAPGAYHPTLHTDIYYDEVNARVAKARSRPELTQILIDIAAELLKDIFPN